MSELLQRAEQAKFVQATFSVLLRLADKLNALLASNRHWYIAIACIAVLQVALILHHVAWLDEWQALLIAWQSPDLSSMLAQLRYEGHPPLWYLVLRGLASVVPFAWVLACAALMMAAVMQAIILFRAPFPRAERLMLAGGQFVLFEYGTISRGLSFGILLSLVALVLWRRRSAWLAIALLPATEFIFGVLSLVLVAFRWRQGDRSVPGYALWIAASLASAWSIRPAADSNPAEIPQFFAIEASEFLQRLGTLAAPFQMIFIRPAWDGFAPLVLGVFLVVPLIVWFWRMTASDRLARTCLFGTVALYLAISMFLYPFHLRHLSLVTWTAVVLVWLNPEQMRGAGWRIWLASCAICGMATSAVALTWKFDAAPEVARMAERIDDGKRPWLAFPASRSPSLHPHTAIRFVEPEQGCVHSFAHWNYRRKAIRAKQIRFALEDWAERYGESYLILESLPSKVPKDVFQPLTKTYRAYNGQQYTIGILGRGRPIKLRNYPDCVPNLREIPRP